ncbi:hypothetical protein [Streptomyces europaeiscabiei]|uniref:hypothetical protein n=1 Tax=Streptomyces europaeiscabiei TaxID=146819 RepID=UPI0029AE449F|nr:hypothetical protein [Streptomyces europaeiscabiei]MDX3839851.1 hypothetical protein [Streptomyces europaeiscabiei]
MTAELTEQQRYDRRLKAARAITAALKQTHHEWHRLNDGDWRLLGDIAMDALGDMAAEILTDGTLLKGLDIRDGVVTLETEPAREILLTLVASMRGMLDGYGAENYLETEITDADKKRKVELDLQDGQNPADSYTVTIQRRYRPTPHEFRQRAEKQRDDVLRIVADWYASSEGRDVLVEDLAAAGFPIPEDGR